ncbi:MAG: DUF3857 domain-containing protein [Candidatus Glassbacteria bacterium]|nr:DUF3857 domain-containing protein [Candidatus Glassbacteria bacterium]
MIPIRCLSVFLVAVLAWTAQVFALTDTLEELIQEKGIIMLDLAARYPDAEAVILLYEEDVDQSRIINPVYISRHVVVKILKESAVEKFRTVKLPFYEEVKVVDMEARTINDGNIIKVKDIPERKPELEGQDADFIYAFEQRNTMFAVRSVEVNENPNAGDLLKISDNPVFHKKGAEVWRIRQIDFPEVRVGSVLEYFYRIEQKRIVLYERFFFQQEYPVLKSILSMHNAKLLRFAYEINNFTTKPEISFEPRFTNLESQYNNQIRTAMRTIDVTDRPENWQFYGHQFFQIQMDTLDAYPAWVPFAPPYGDVAPRADAFLREAVNLWQKSPQDIRIRTESFSPNWNFPVYRLSQSTIIDARRCRRAKDAIAEAIKDAASPEEKVAAAVRWTRENIKDNGELGKWDSYFWGCLPKDPDVVLRDGAGNAAEIVAFLVNALQLNDLWAYPAYAKTRDHGELLNKVFMEAQFDVPLVALEVGPRRFKFWQASTDIPLPVDHLDWSLEGVRVLINTSGENDITYRMDNLPVSPSTDSRSVINATLTLGQDGSVAGKLTQDLTGHLGAGLRHKLFVAPADQRGNIWEKSLTGTFSGIALQGQPSLDDPALFNSKYTATADVALEKVCSAVDGGLALNATMVTDPFSVWLSGEERELDVRFPFLAEFSCDIELKVPAGYALPDSLPEPLELRTKGLYYQRILAKKGGDTLLLKREFKMDEPALPVRNYNRRYASIFANIQKADAEKIILKKQ